MLDHILISEMTDPIFHWAEIEQIAKTKQPLIVYSKAPIPIEFLIDNPQIGVNITISGWGNTWLEPGVLDPKLMIDYFNELTTKINIDRIRLRIDPGVPTLTGRLRAQSVLKGIDRLPKILTSLIQYYSWHRDVFKKLNIDMKFYTIKSGTALFPKKSLAERWFERLLEVRPDANGLISFCGMPYVIDGAIHGGCVDADLLQAIGVIDFKRIQSGKQRPGCKCIIKKKQACFGSCEHKCQYCYAHRENAKFT